MNPATALRRELHRHPELSGVERKTARRIVRFFQGLGADAVVEGLGGHGVAAVFDGADAGPTVMLRCELDAVPVRETNRFSHRSSVEGVAHQCGHDGHMAILAAVGEHLSRHRPRKGRVVLLFQPSEEDGRGAAAVLADPHFPALRPDLIFGLHNLPGFPLGEVLLSSGTFTCASRGMRIGLHGRTAHAAQPQTGCSPAHAMCRIIQALHGLPADLAPDEKNAFATVVGARLGEGEPFGTAPGDAVVLATLRSESEAAMARIVAFCECVAEREAKHAGLRWEIAYRDVFLPTVNAEAAVEMIRRAAEPASVTRVEQPFAWSEDFGRFTAAVPGALLGIGAGQGTADLHRPDYDFPDELIPLAAGLWRRLLDRISGE